jgi:hypothetical protein
MDVWEVLRVTLVRVAILRVLFLPWISKDLFELNI